MFELAYHTIAGLLAVLLLTYFRIARGISYSGGVPRIGQAGLYGYIATALRYTFNAEAVFVEGRDKYSGLPFAIPTLSGIVFILGPEYLEKVRSSLDDVFNSPLAVGEDLQLSYTMDAHQMENPYQASVLRTDVNRAIPSYIPEILEESMLAIDETLTSPTGDKSLAVFDTMTHLIARISNRVIVGTDLCRNDDFLHAIVEYAEGVTLMAPFLHWSPVVLRRFVYFALSLLWGGKRTSMKFIVPFLKGYMKQRELLSQTPTVTEYLLRGAPSHETVEGLAVRLLNINFGSIHTSSVFITQALFELTLLSKEELDGVREETQAALESEGGWTKLALLKFRKIDSALREVGRIHGLMHIALPRVAMRGVELPDGTRIPPGHRVGIDMKAIHLNPKTYPDPYRCDLFRFSKLREAEGNDSKYGFATLDSHYLPFGAGRHACAGRFFAAMELKIMLAHILLNYDFSFPPGVNGRPANLLFNGAVIPDTKAQIVFRPR